MTRNLFYLLESFHIPLTLFTIIMFLIGYFWHSLYLNILAAKRHMKGKWKSWLPIIREFYSLDIAVNIKGAECPGLSAVFTTIQGIFIFFIALALFGVAVPQIFIILSFAAVICVRVPIYNMIWNKISEDLAEMAFLVASIKPFLVICEIIHILSGYINRVEDAEETKNTDSSYDEIFNKTKEFEAANKKVEIAQNSVKEAQEAINEAKEALEKAKTEITWYITILDKELAKTDKKHNRQEEFKIIHDSRIDVMRHGNPSDVLLDKTSAYVKNVRAGLNMNKLELGENPYQE